MFYYYFILPSVCILPLVCSLQSAFYPRSAVCSLQSSFYTDRWSTLLANFGKFCEHSIVTDADEICDMAAVRDLSTSDAVFKSVIKNMFKDFSHVECCREEQKDCINNMVNGKDVFAILPTGFGNSFIFQLFPRIMSSMNGKSGAVSMTMVVRLALVAIVKDQFEQVTKIGIVAIAIVLDEEEWG